MVGTHWNFALVANSLYFSVLSAGAECTSLSFGLCSCLTKSDMRQGKFFAEIYLMFLGNSHKGHGLLDGGLQGSHSCSTSDMRQGKFFAEIYQE